MTYTYKNHYIRDILHRCSIRPTKVLLLQMSNAFKSTDTIKTMDQLVKAKILLTKKKNIVMEMLMLTKHKTSSLSVNYLLLLNMICNRYWKREEKRKAAANFKG